ncbi:MAG: hypothetical protein H6622_02375 [Halobacteriovoraceae bacterium]|nr:hypothetical protein [Halobacteriovoraceae bacterium]
MSDKVNCYKCGNELRAFTPGMRVSRSDECEHCYASLRCCKMCEFFDESSYNECREPVAQRIVDKEKVNFCDYYKFISQNKSEMKSKEDMFSAADALFKK